MKKLTSIVFFTIASFNLSAHGVGIHIHGNSVLGLGVLAILLAVPVYFLSKSILTKET